jgi:hypothetical protein
LTCPLVHMCLSKAAVKQLLSPVPIDTTVVKSVLLLLTITQVHTVKQLLSPVPHHHIYRKL